MEKQQIVDRFFELYSTRQLDKINTVMHPDSVWYFEGDHKLGGTWLGIQEILDFFDRMGAIMKESKPDIQKLIVEENENHLIECQRIIINREDGISIDHHVSVLWTFSEGRIISGRHFFADPVAAANYFNAVAK